uniref:EF-hand domain-containing protein n=1 Tax=Periophthalmus magnuspinnatus TaxID=409849 RepID=A0A3B4AJE4_9GOBI
ALELPLIDLAFDDCDITVSEGPLRIFNFSSLLEFNQMVVRLGLKGSTNPAVLGRQAEEARRLRGEGLNVEDFAQRLGLSVSDKLRQVHGVFDQVETEDGLIDYRRYVIALSTVYQPKKTKETLKLAFKMYQDEDDGSVTEEDLAAILEIMLGVEKVDLSGLFLSLQEETGKITYAVHVLFVVHFTNHKGQRKVRERSEKGRRKVRERSEKGQRKVSLVTQGQGWRKYSSLLLIMSKTILK